MLRKLALAVGAVAFCGAIQAQAGTSYQNGGESHYGDFNQGDNDYKGDMGDGCGCVKIIVPKFDSTCDVASWIQTLDTKESHGNVFDELVNGCSPKDLGLCLPKCEITILGDIQSDIKDVDKDFDKLSKDEHDDKGYGDKGHGDDCGIKDLQQAINCDLTDIQKETCDFASGLKDMCHPDHQCDPEPTVTAVPLPAAASQGLIGLGLLGCLSLVGAARRRVFGRA